MFDIYNFEEGAPTPPDPSLNPGDKGLKSLDIPVLQKAQVPNLPVTPGKEGPTLIPAKSPSQNPVTFQTSGRYQPSPGTRITLQCSTSTSSPILQVHLTLIHT